MDHLFSLYSSSSSSFLFQCHLWPPATHRAAGILEGCLRSQRTWGEHAAFFLGGDGANYCTIVSLPVSPCFLPLQHLHSGLELHMGTSEEAHGLLLASKPWTEDTLPPLSVIMMSRSITNVNVEVLCGASSPTDVRPFLLQCLVIEPRCMNTYAEVCWCHMVDVDSEHLKPLQSLSLQLWRLWLSSIFRDKNFLKILCSDSGRIFRKNERMWTILGLKDEIFPDLLFLHWPLWTSGVLRTHQALSLGLQWVELWLERHGPAWRSQHNRMWVNPCHN